jgi:hypothetical protein
MRDAYQTDTMRTVVGFVPRVSERAVSDSDSPCGGWSAYSRQASPGLYIMNGGIERRQFEVTGVKNEAAPTGPPATRQCNPQQRLYTEFIAFLLGDFGDRATEPITLCYSRCAKSYVLDPARHTLAEKAHFRFRISDLRENTRIGDQLILRIQADPAPTGFLPLVAASASWGHDVWIAQRSGSNTWDFGVLHTPGFDPSTEIRIYLVAR